MINDKFACHPCTGAINKCMFYLTETWVKKNGHLNDHKLQGSNPQMKASNPVY